MSRDWKNLPDIDEYNAARARKVSAQNSSAQLGKTSDEPDKKVADKLEPKNGAVEVPEWMLVEGRADILKAKNARDKAEYEAQLYRERQQQAELLFRKNLELYGPMAQAKADQMIKDFLKLANGRSNYIVNTQGWYLTASYYLEPGDWETSARDHYNSGLILDIKGRLKMLSGFTGYTKPVLHESPLYWDASRLKGGIRAVKIEDMFGQNPKILPSFLQGIVYPHCGRCAPGEPRLGFSFDPGENVHRELLSKVLIRVAIEKGWVL